MSISRNVLTARPKTSSGRRDKYVAIEYLVSSAPGPTRFPVEVWEPLANEWMRREESRADEREAANQEVASTETFWEMAYRADMDPDLLNVPASRRLHYQGRIYDITAASTIGTNRGIELLTIARTDRVDVSPPLDLGIDGGAPSTTVFTGLLDGGGV